MFHIIDFDLVKSLCKMAGYVTTEIKTATCPDCIRIYKELTNASD